MSCGSNTVTPQGSIDGGDPPSYAETLDAGDAFKSIEQLWDDHYRHEDVLQQLAKQKYNVFFTWRSSDDTEYSPLHWLPRWLFGCRKTQPMWLAFLRARTKNLPRLMKSGFRWSSTNVVPGLDKMFEEFVDTSTLLLPYIHNGYYYLHHRVSQIQPQHTDDPEWAGELHVYSNDASVLLNFNVDGLARSMPFEVTCCSSDRGMVYNFDAVRVRNPRFNMIYPGMLLDGSWPWPRADQQDIKTDVAEDIEECEDIEKTEDTRDDIQFPHVPDHKAILEGYYYVHGTE